MKKLLFVVLAVLALASFANLVPAEASVFSVWADTNNDSIKDLFLGNTTNYAGTSGGAANYNFYSDSGHPINGPATEAGVLKLFIYENTTNQRYFLNVIGGKDGVGGSGAFGATIDITGSTYNPGVVVTDDSGELKEPSANHFVGTWSYNNNADGGVIGPLQGPWEAMITPTVQDNLQSHGVYSADGSVIYLDGGSDVTGAPKYYRFYVSNAVVPEPASMALLGLGLLGLLRKKR